MMRPGMIFFFFAAVLGGSVAHAQTRSAPAQRDVPTTQTPKSPSETTGAGDRSQKEIGPTGIVPPDGATDRAPPSKLQPGESFQYTFDREGEYWYNDCTDPRPTGRVNVTAQVIDVPGALTIVPSILNLKPLTGVFTSVVGVINAVFRLPDGYTLDTGFGAKVTMKAPLSTELFEAVSVSVSSDGKTLTVSGLFQNGGVQKRLTATANARVLK